MTNRERTIREIILNGKIDYERKGGIKLLIKLNIDTLHFCDAVLYFYLVSKADYNRFNIKFNNVKLKDLYITYPGLVIDIIRKDRKINFNKKDIILG